MEDQKIKPNIWYAVKCQASRENFIERCLNDHKDCKVHPDSEILKYATCLRYNSETNAVNYRCNYDERYMGKIREYIYIPKIIFDGLDSVPDTKSYFDEYIKKYYENQKVMEENNMIPDYMKVHVGDCACSPNAAPNYDPIVENYIKKERNKIQQEGQKQRDEIIAGSTLGKIAKNYYEAMEIIKPDCYHGSIESMVPFDFLSKEEQKKIHDINEKENARCQELSELREVIMFKLSFCKTLRQREDVYDDYDLD